MFLIERGVPSIIFAVLFTALLVGSLWCLKNWGRRSGYAKLCVFCAIRMGAAICGIIIAADNYSNINVIIAEIVMTQVGSFMIYYTLVGFYHVSAKYYGFWQGDTAKLVDTMQRLTLYVLIALAIASGIEGSNYTNAASVELAVRLAKAYSVIYIFLLTVNAIQWGGLWFRRRMTGDVFSICCTIALVFVYLKAIYLVASSWITDISLRNPFINAGWYVGAAFAPDFLAALLCVIAGLMAPADRREAAKHFVTEQRLQQQGARYNYDGEPPVEQTKYNDMNGGMSYART